MPRREVEKNEEVEEKQVRQAWQAAGPRRSRRPQGKGAVCLLLIVSINHFSRGSINLSARERGVSVITTIAHHRRFLRPDHVVVEERNLLYVSCSPP